MYVSFQNILYMLICVIIHRELNQFLWIINHVMTSNIFLRKSSVRITFSILTLMILVHTLRIYHRHLYHRYYCFPYNINDFVIYFLLENSILALLVNNHQISISLYDIPKPAIYTSPYTYFLLRSHYVIQFHIE